MLTPLLYFIFSAASIIFIVCVIIPYILRKKLLNNINKRNVLFDTTVLYIQEESNFIWPLIREELKKAMKNYKILKKLQDREN